MVQELLNAMINILLDASALANNKLYQLLKINHYKN